MHSASTTSLCVLVLLLSNFEVADPHGGFGGLRGLGMIMRMARFGHIGRGFGRGFGGRGFGGGFNNGYYNNGNYNNGYYGNSYYNNGYYGNGYYGSNYYGNGYNYWG
ncbi:hypothetical protein AAVH_29711 [Aphelenchoides avenae]|nr:hypothetical protein AAVH_29711 [Aphelenchus avenae]